MKREKAIKYLEKKGKLSKRKFSEKNEEKIKEVMKEGKIYGDPVAEVQW